MNDVTSMSIVTSAKTGVMRGVEGEVFGCSVLSSQPLYKSKTVSKVKVYCVGQVWRYTLIIPEPRKVKRGGIRSSRSFSATKQGCGHPGLHGTLS